MKVIFDIPFPAYSGNHQHVRVGKRSFVHPKILAYRSAVWIEVRSLVRPIPVVAVECDIALSIWTPDRRRRDLDNILKVVLDALEYAELYRNDALIKSLHAERKGVEKPGRIGVSLTWEPEE